MDLSSFFLPLEFEKENFKKNSLGDKTGFYSFGGNFPELDNAHLAIIGVPEERGSPENIGCSEAPDAVRKFLYTLYHRDHDVKLVDLGNINLGASLNDTYFALRDILVELLGKKIIPIIIGGSQDLTFANYLAYEKLEQVVNLVTIDNQFNLGDVGEEINSNSFLSKIILHQPNYLFNYSNIGYQTYFVDKNAIELMTKLNFDIHRLGEVTSDIKQMEPILRNADVISFDVSAIRQSDAPGNINATPNGMYGEEVCQLAWYAGISDKLTSIGFYEANPSFDRRDQTSHVVGQTIWHFIDGFYNRKKEFPFKDKKNFIKYRVNLENSEHELIFFKSKKSDRWWMDIPFPPHKGMKYERHQIVPCSYDDYKTACSNEMPEIWLKTYQKLL